MSGHHSYNFSSVFDTTTPAIPRLHLKECEIYILWTLGEEGPMFIYGIAKRSGYLPNISPVFEPEPLTWKSKMEEKQKYDRGFVHTKVGELLKKRLVQKQEIVDPKTQKIRKGVGLTFLGLMFYLQRLEKPDRSPDEKLKRALGKYKMLIPFSEQWNLLVKDLGENKCMRAFAKTVKEFVDIRNVRFRVPSAKLVFDGFLKQPLSSHNDPEADTKATRERDVGVAKCLEKKEMSMLRDCYIAYLAVNDIDKFSEENEEELESEKELTYFRKGDVMSETGFRGEKLKEFFPKYSSIEHFFTGMFIKNLLWSEKTT